MSGVTRTNEAMASVQGGMPGAAPASALAPTVPSTTGRPTAPASDASRGVEQLLGELLTALNGLIEFYGRRGGGGPGPGANGAPATDVAGARRTLGQSAPQDGPGVVRTVVSRAKLEQDPQLRGQLDPPKGGTPPKGVTVHRDGSGARVLTINIHAATPAGKERGPKGEDMRALRDVAAYVNSIDPDVVMVQEMHDRKFSPGTKGIGPMSSVMAHLISASDMAFTPGKFGRKTAGTAIYTRNGHTIDRAANVNLPELSEDAKRSAGVAAIRPPDGRPAFSLISTHMSNDPALTGSKRRQAQLKEIQRIATAIQRTGSFSYRTGNGTRTTLSGLPKGRLVVGGDLNTTEQGRRSIDSADHYLNQAGLRHANDLLTRGGTRNKAALGHRIDHIYAKGYRATSVALAEVGKREYRAGAATDHPGYVTDLR